MVRLIMCGWYPEEIEQWKMKKTNSEKSNSEKMTKTNEDLTRCKKSLEKQTK